MTNPITRTLEHLTMYRVVLYVLTAMSFYAIVGSLVGIVPFTILSLITSFAILMVVTPLFNVACTRILGTTPNHESAFITAFILFLILVPPESTADALVVLGTAIAAIGSKHLITWNGQHLFNPAAFGLIALMLIGRGDAFWWVGSSAFFPVALIGGALLLTKLREWKFFIVFALAALFSTLATGTLHSLTVSEILLSALLSGPLIFFGTVMLTEPQTAPTTHLSRMFYAGVVGILYGVNFSFGTFSLAPESALIIGNIVFFLAQPKRKLLLTLQSSKEIAHNTYEYIFKNDKKPLNFRPGQYLEWTLPHSAPDSRGIRRYFTIASSPHEDTIRLAMRTDPAQASTYKKKLLSLKPGDTLVVHGLAGDFVMPRNPDMKQLWIAGGIGVTPFRSMVGELHYTNETRDIALLYANKTESEIAYHGIFDQARAHGVSTTYVVGEGRPSAHTFVGTLDSTSIASLVPDVRDRTCYVSGPPGMVRAMKSALRSLGVPRRHIITDFFPGY